MRSGYWEGSQGGGGSVGERKVKKRGLKKGRVRGVCGIKNSETAKRRGGEG